MERNEKLAMYNRKKIFIERLKKALTNPAPFGSSISDIQYEVYESSKEDRTFYEEFIVLWFGEDASCPICVNGNSDCANLRVIANNCFGGMYDDTRFYNHITETYTRVEL